MGQATVRQVSARDNPLLVRIRKLVHDPGAYRKLGAVWVEGDHLILAAIARGVRPQAVVVDEAAAPRFAALLHAGTEAVSVPSAAMKSLSSLESPPAIGALIPWPSDTALQPGVATVVLDRIQDAGNVGSILRSAAAFGFAQVVALTGTASPWSPKVLRAGMGAHFALRLVEHAAHDVLDQIGVPAVATSSHAPATLAQASLPWPCAWVFGHEGQGVAEALMQRCAHTVRIPQPGGEESLNVAAAAAICLYESARRRQ
jgi:RNA methyltransferase, TrmH family